MMNKKEKILRATIWVLVVLIVGAGALIVNSQRETRPTVVYITGDTKIKFVNLAQSADTTSQNNFAVYIPINTVVEAKNIVARTNGKRNPAVEQALFLYLSQIDTLIPGEYIFDMIVEGVYINIAFYID